MTGGVLVVVILAIVGDAMNLGMVYHSVICAVLVIIVVAIGIQLGHRGKRREAGRENWRLENERQDEIWQQKLLAAKEAAAERMRQTPQEADAADVADDDEYDEEGWRPGFARIEFEYSDRFGNQTHRMVDVWAVDDEYMEGWCHVAREKRTFVIWKMTGIRHTGTDENLTARAWAAAAMCDPRNGSVDYRELFKQQKRRTAKPPVTRPAQDILFTGFSKPERQRLETLATEHGMTVRSVVTQNLSYLCVGKNAGGSKIKQAQENHAVILTPDELMRLWETGELPAPRQ